MLDGDGGGNGGYKADLEQLLKIGSTARDVGDKMVTLSQEATEEVAAAVRAHPGWLFAPKLEEAQATCERNIEGYGRWATDVDDRLTAAVDEYRRTDQWAMDLLNGNGV
ncbi:hypothetical protein [Haloactinomyces albus]|uniref:Excreted virulence factor EspC, type VII ESX diderm n=1 Tax=Haloactinomyces albus TaxID=1352928 RepID=A0AAE3ZFX0_9ACTN|nr:hypothetical protein [Haloactinomyces albus]MDR7304203.1 hypothetical protein [Haloactinomyces albus]